MFYTHMPLLLTQFHLYCQTSILQHLYLYTMELQLKCAFKQSVKQILCQGMRRQPIQLTNLGQTPPWLCSRPTKRPTRRKRWRDGPGRVWPHGPQLRSVPPRSSGSLMPCRGSSAWFPNLSLTKPTSSMYKQRCRGPHSTHTTQEPLSHTCIFLLFLVVLFGVRQETSLKSLYLENSWYE